MIKLKSYAHILLNIALIITFLLIAASELIAAANINLSIISKNNAVQLSQNQNEHATPLQADQSDKAKSQAEIAREAYDKSDATPTENWFGCPPGSVPSNTAAAPEETDCMPQESQ